MIQELKDEMGFARYVTLFLKLLEIQLDTSVRIVYFDEVGPHIRPQKLGRKYFTQSYIERRQRSSLSVCKWPQLFISVTRVVSL